jgi:hypothetical protein
MSYLGRVAQRAAGVRSGAGLVPVGRSSSPLASFDQRLNLVPGLASGTPPRSDSPASIGEAPGGALDDPFASAELGLPASASDLPAPAAFGTGQAPPARPAAEAPAFAPAGPVPAAAVPPAAASLDDHAGRTARVHDGGLQSPPSPRADRRGSAPVETAARDPGLPEPIVNRRSRAPAHQARAPLAEAGDGSADAGRDRGAAADATGDMSRASGPARAPASSAAAPGAAGRDPLTEALARLDRWLASEPRAGRTNRGEAGAAEPSSAGDGGPRPGAAAGPRSPVAARRQSSGRGGPALLAAPAASAAPVLRIGRIEVQVVQPAPPPAVVSAPPRRQAPTARAAAGSGSWWGPPAHLLFGLRQR